MAGRLPWHSTCLVLAVALRLMLARRGIPAVIRLGVRKVEGGLSAHAWLLVGGEAVLGAGEASSFQPLADFWASTEIYG